MRSFEEEIAVGFKIPLPFSSVGEYQVLRRTQHRHCYDPSTRLFFPICEILSDAPDKVSVGVQGLMRPLGVYRSVTNPVGAWGR